MNEKAVWIGVIAGGTLAAAGLGALNWFQHSMIEEARVEVAQMRTEIATSRKLIEGTSTLEREVIVLRELSEVMQGILPDTEDVNNLVRTLQRFSEDSEVRIRGLKKKSDSAQQNAAFDGVGYTLTLEADVFQFMDFIDYVESHSRFMKIPRFKFTAAKRQQFEADGYAAHRIQLDVDTFVYDPGKDAKPVKIEGYERKRDLLVGEINRRRQQLTVATFNYRGPRGRRDPWVDPRVPVAGDGESVLTVQEQMDIVQALYEKTQQILSQQETVAAAENVIEEMMARADLEDMMADVEEQLRRITSEGSITYLPSQRRLQLEVVDVIDGLRTKLATSEGGRGPSVEKLREVLETMQDHLVRQEYELMLDAYRLVGSQLDYVERDALRKPFVTELRRLERLARVVLDFDEIDIRVTGVAIEDGLPPVALINGRSVGVGDVLDGELFIRDIRAEEIEFIFRGVVLARRF